MLGGDFIMLQNAISPKIQVLLVGAKTKQIWYSPNTQAAMETSPTHFYITWFVFNI